LTQEFFKRSASHKGEDVGGKTIELVHASYVVTLSVRRQSRRRVLGGHLKQADRVTRA